MILQPAHDHVRARGAREPRLESRAGWHEALARAFEDVQGEAQLDSQAVVEHWLAAGHPANAAHHAVAAALRAEEALAFRRAAELYEIALAYGPWDAAGQRDLLRKQGARARVRRASSTRRRRSTATPRSCCPTTRRSISSACASRRCSAAAGSTRRCPRPSSCSRRSACASRSRSALAHAARDAVDAAEAARPRVRRARRRSECRPSDLLRDRRPVLDRRAGSRSPIRRSAASLQAELMRAALECGEPVRVCLALAQEVCYAAARGQPQRAAPSRRSARGSMRSRDRIGAPARRSASRDAAIGIAAYMSGRWRDARGYLEAGPRDAARARRRRALGDRYRRDATGSRRCSTSASGASWRGRAQLPAARGARSRRRRRAARRCAPAAATWRGCSRDRARRERARSSPPRARRSPSGFHAAARARDGRGVQRRALHRRCGRGAARLADAWPQHRAARRAAVPAPARRARALCARRVALADRRAPLDDRARIARAISRRRCSRKARRGRSASAMLLRAAALALRGDAERRARGARTRPKNSS